MRGITEVLSRVFWPSFNYRKAVKDVGTPASVSGPKSARGGMRRGNDVDFQIRAFANEGKAVSHPFARKLLKALSLNGLSPHRGQLRVADEETGLFTGVDLVCKRSNGAVVLVEIKCGFGRAGVYDAANDKMRGCLSDLTNCPRNQHAVQTAVTRFLFTKTFPELPPPDAIVARVSDDGVYFHPVPQEVLKRAKSIAFAISKSRPVKKRSLRGPASAKSFKGKRPLKKNARPLPAACKRDK